MHRFSLNSHLRLSSTLFSFGDLHTSWLGEAISHIWRSDHVRSPRLLVDTGEALPIRVMSLRMWCFIRNPPDNLYKNYYTIIILAEYKMKHIKEHYLFKTKSKFYTHFEEFVYIKLSHFYVLFIHKLHLNYFSASFPDWNSWFYIICIMSCIFMTTGSRNFKFRNINSALLLAWNDFSNQYLMCRLLRQKYKLTIWNADLFME